MLTYRLLIAAVVSAAATGAAIAQDVTAGEAIFKKSCFICHAVGEGAKDKVGPELNGLDGRKAGTVATFTRYSPANKNSGIVWDEAQFLDYIKAPRTKIPGTIMTFPGIQNPADAKNLWAYLAQFGPDGKKK